MSTDPLPRHHVITCKSILTSDTQFAGFALCSHIVKLSYYYNRHENSLSVCCINVQSFNNKALFIAEHVNQGIDILAMTETYLRSYAVIYTPVLNTMSAKIIAVYAYFEAVDCLSKDYVFVIYRQLLLNKMDLENPHIFIELSEYLDELSLFIHNSETYKKVSSVLSIGMHLLHDWCPIIPWVW